MNCKYVPDGTFSANIMRVHGIAMIQDVTRPLGIPLQHSSVPFQLSASNQLMIQNMKTLKDRIKDIDTISQQLDKDIELLIQMYGYLQEVDRTFDDTAEVTERTVESPTGSATTWPTSTTSSGSWKRRSAAHGPARPWP